MQFLSPAWLAALDETARAVPVVPSLAEVTLSIGQEIVDGPSWCLHVDGGRLRVERGSAADADIRLRCDRATAASIAAGERSALDAFIVGDLRLGGRTDLLLAHRAAFEAVGDLFAAVKADTDFSA